MKMPRSMGSSCLSLVTGIVALFTATPGWTVEYSAQAVQESIPYFDHTPDGVFRVHESTFNELAAAVLPLQVSGANPQRISQTFGWCPFCYTVEIELCSGEWEATVSGLDFDITSTNIKVSGNASASYNCLVAIPFSMDFSSRVHMKYDRTLNALTVITESERIQPFFDVPVLGRYHLPKIIDAGPSLTLPPIPVTTAKFAYETAKGPSHMRMDSSNISVIKRDGHIEVKGKVHVW